MKPDASNHNPGHEYLRSLIARAGLSQAQAAQLIGIDERGMRYRLTDPASGKRHKLASYSEQYALESLADKGAE